VDETLRLRESERERGREEGDSGLAGARAFYRWEETTSWSVRGAEADSECCFGLVTEERHVAGNGGCRYRGSNSGGGACLSSKFKLGFDGEGCGVRAEPLLCPLVLLLLLSLFFSFF
jgi:hypothetical protein